MTDKLPKSEVEFESPAKGKDHCGDCKHFLFNTKECKIVAGRVWWDDWCKKFSARNEKK